MSTDLGTLVATGSRDVRMSLTRFYGGDRKGPCLQLTANMEDGATGYIQLSAADMVALLPIFKSVIDMTLEAKKNEAEQAIRENEALRKTIIEDIRGVCQLAISQPIFDM